MPRQSAHHDPAGLIDGGGDRRFHQGMDVLRSAPNEQRSVSVMVDVSRNLLCVHFREVVTANDAKGYLGEVEKLLPELETGFTFLTDLTGLERMELECVAYITRVMDVCLANGLGKVVRIIPDPQKDIGFKLLSLVHYRGKVPIATCATRMEAESELSGS